MDEVVVVVEIVEGFADNVSKSPKEPIKKSPMDELIRLMDQEKLEELEVWDGKSRVKLSRQSQQAMAPVAPVTRSVTKKKETPSAAKSVVEQGTPIKSPLAGVFYRAPSPQAPSFVKEGDIVSPEKTVCIVEAMKVLNQINAGVSGRIVKICVENGKPISSGQVLFYVESES